MKKFLFLIFIMVVFQFLPFSLADSDDNWGISPKSKSDAVAKEASEEVWDDEMNSYIESQYGSNSSNYYLNRGDAGDYDNTTGGDAFDSTSY